ncbi:MAG: hypothetical protein LC623_03890 [Halobacteriales archaeon]|nr:hypothetical protein [Halobacteriales archaeon]
MGQLLIFAIVSILLVLSMLAFNQAQTAARDRVVALRAESAATRVSGIVVQTALIAEQQGIASTVRFLVDLPSQLEGLPYTVSLVPAAGGVPAHIGLTVPRIPVTVTAALFSADAATSTAGFDICSSTVGGGRLNVRFDARPASCTGTHTYALFLESTS